VTWVASRVSWLALTTPLSPKSLSLEHYRLHRFAKSQKCLYLGLMAEFERTKKYVKETLKLRGCPGE
jgi:hypothetical protein